MLHFGKIPKTFRQIWRKFSKILANFAKFWKKTANNSAIFNENFEIRDRGKGVHCVDLGESFPTHIYLQNLASVQPRTSPFKFDRSPRTDPPGAGPGGAARRTVNGAPGGRRGALRGRWQGGARGPCGNLQQVAPRQGAGSLRQPLLAHGSLVEVRRASLTLQLTPGARHNGLRRLLGFLLGAPAI